MSKRETIKVRAPKDIMLNLRIKFPNISDANLIRFAYNSSMLRLEAGLRKSKKKRGSNEII